MIDRRALLDFAPWQLSGLVVGALMNHRRALEALGDTVNQPPYMAPPKAPVLFIKPRNTLASAGRGFTLPPGVTEVELGIHLGLVISRTVGGVAAHSAAGFIAGVMAVVDLSVPHRSFYRPSLRFKALDGSCLLGPAVAGLGPVQGLEDLIRSPAQLLADVSAFMTLRAGDVLLLGTTPPLRSLRAGDRAEVVLPGLPSFGFEVRS